MKPYSKESRGISYVLIFGLVSLVISLALILLLNKLEAVDTVPIINNAIHFPERVIWHVILEHIATAFFILGVWHTADQLVIKREFNSEVIDHFTEFSHQLMAQVRANGEAAHLAFEDAKISQSSIAEELRAFVDTARSDARFGLLSIYDNANILDFSETLRTCKRFIAVMAIGDAWITRHFEAIKERLHNPELETIFVFSNPTSEQLPIAARKKGMQIEGYLQRLNDTLRQIRNLAKDNAKVKILGHSLISNHCLYVTERSALLSPYFLSNQIWNCPVFEFKDSGPKCYYERLASDVAALLSECVDLRSEALRITAAVVPAAK